MQFLNVKNVLLNDITQQMRVVYGQECVDISNDNIGLHMFIMVNLNKSP
jgi:hypothetical protein